MDNRNNLVGILLYLCCTPLLFTASYALILTGNPFLILSLFLVAFIILAIVQSRNYSHGNESNAGSLTTERIREAQEKYIEEVIKKRCGRLD